MPMIWTNELIAAVRIARNRRPFFGAEDDGSLESELIARSRGRRTVLSIIA
jgi:hypothetical protein